MAEFKLEILTPKKQFFSDFAQAITFQCETGELCVLANHQSMVAALIPGEIKIKHKGKWINAFISEGFVEVVNNTVSVFTQMCEWPEDIDEARAKNAIARDREQLRNTESLSEHRRSEVELRRMMTMLQVKKKNINIK